MAAVQPSLIINGGTAAMSDAQAGGRGKRGMRWRGRRARADRREGELGERRRRGKIELQDAML